MPTIDEIYGSAETLKAVDLPLGTPVPVVIESANPRHFDDATKLELRFRGKRKALLLNPTNARRIADLLGNDYSRWPGSAINLIRTVTPFRGVETPCIRIAEPAVPTAANLPSPAAEPATGQVGDDCPF